MTFTTAALAEGRRKEARRCAKTRFEKTRRRQVTYNKDQWIESFEGRLQLLRPHLTGRVLASISNTTWHSRGTQGEDPIKTANAVSKELDARAEKKR